MELPRMGSNQSYSCWPTPQPQQHQIWAASATCNTAHGNARHLTHWVRTGIEPTTSWFLVGFTSTVPWWELQEFDTFLCIGRCKCQGSLKSLLGYAPQLSGASILFFLILSLIRVVAASAGGLIASILFLFLVPSGLTIWMTALWWHDCCSIIYLFIWWKTFFFFHWQNCPLVSLQSCPVPWWVYIPVKPLFSGALITMPKHRLDFSDGNFSITSLPSFGIHVLTFPFCEWDRW